MFISIQWLALILFAFLYMLLQVQPWMISPTSSGHFGSPLEGHMRPFGLNFALAMCPSFWGSIGESPMQWHWVESDLRKVPGRPALSRPCRWSSRRRNFSVRTPNWVIQVSILIISESSSTWSCQICYLSNFCTMPKCHLYRDVWMNLHLCGLNCYFTNNGICAPFYLYSLQNMVGNKTRGTHQFK